MGEHWGGTAEVERERGQSRAQSHCFSLDSWWVFEEKKVEGGG